MCKVVDKHRTGSNLCATGHQNEISLLLFRETFSPWPRPPLCCSRLPRWRARRALISIRRRSAKQRAAILLKATHAPITDLENDVNHLAVLSETCRAESGAKACGLSDKPLGSDKLDDRYAYYVRRPVEAHASGRQAKIDRHNWEAPPAPPR